MDEVYLTLHFSQPNKLKEQTDKLIDQFVKFTPY